jgi:hypothetical protein
VVYRQYNEIKAAFEEIKSLKDTVLVGTYKNTKTEH